MDKMGIWLKPVTMTAMQPPPLEVDGNLVFTNMSDGRELTRCVTASETLELSDESIVAIGEGALSSLSALKDVSLPERVRRIGSYAFFQCENLTSVRLPDSLRVIGDFAFTGCKALKTLYVPASVVSIGAHAFQGLENLTLCGAENSAIHRHAVENGLFFMTAGGPSAAA